MALVLGLDSGSTATKGVLMNGETIVGVYSTPTAHSPKHSLNLAFENLTQGINLSEVKVVATGYGRELAEMAAKRVTEITCHGRGAAYLGTSLHKSIRCVIDIGGQDVKAIKLDTNGFVEDFLMNDKCAAGTGRFVELLTSKLGLDLDCLDTQMAQAFPVKISSMCTVFAESEVIGLLAAETAPSSIAMGIFMSIAERTAHFVKKTDPEPDIFFSGGLARSQTMIQWLSQYLEAPIITHELSPYAGAIGAALSLGSEKRNRRQVVNLSDL